MVPLVDGLILNMFPNSWYIINLCFYLPLNLVVSTCRKNLNGNPGVGLRRDKLAARASRHRTVPQDSLPAGVPRRGLTVNQSGGHCLKELKKNV